MQNKIEYLLFLTFSFLCRLFGLKLSRYFSIFMALFFFYFIPIRKKTVFENLTFAFPDLNEKQIKEIAVNAYKSFFITLIEILYLPYMKEKEIKYSISINNLQLIKNKFELNKGVILLSAHFGNWEYIAISSSMQVGIPYSVIVKAQRNPYVTKWLDKCRQKWGNKIVPLGASIRQVYTELKERNIIAMVADQRGPEDGIRVNFFGRPASVYPGPAVLAVKTGAPIIYGVAVRQPDFSYITELIEIDLNNLPENQDEKIKEICRRHTFYLEEMIKKYPGQWLWMHERWKY